MSFFNFTFNSDFLNPNSRTTSNGSKFRATGHFSKHNSSRYDIIIMYQIWKLKFRTSAATTNWNFYFFRNWAKNLEVTPVVVIFVIWTCQGCSNSSSCLKTWSLYSNVNQFCNSKGWSGRSGRMITSHWGLNGLCATDGKKNNWGKSNFDISHKIQPLVR